jgi:hypothetical protein
MALSSKPGLRFSLRGHSLLARLGVFAAKEPRVVEKAPEAVTHQEHFINSASKKTYVFRLSALPLFTERVPLIVWIIHPYDALIRYSSEFCTKKRFLTEF